MLRLDTQGSFTDSSSWSAYDAAKAVGAGAVGFTGRVFDGRYVYFSPQLTVPQSGELRYDTQGGFTNASSWTLYEAGTTDGRYIYFAPYYSGSGYSGNVIRFDSRLPRAIPPTVTGGSNL